MLWSGALLMGVGIFLDYWPDPNSWWPSTGFMMEMSGALVLWIGAIVGGIASLREASLSRLMGGLVIGIAPLGIAGISVLGHIPSGPLVGYFILMLSIGIISKDQN